jgi:hypothetical protein
MALLNTTSKYITDPLRPNVSIPNPNYLAPSSVTKPITAESLTKTNTPVNVTGTVKDPNADKYASILSSIQSITAGIQATQNSLNQYKAEEAKKAEVKQPEQNTTLDSIKQYMGDMEAIKPVNKAENPAYATAESDVTALGKTVAENKNIVAQGNAKLAGIGAQIQQIVDATTARKLEIGKEGISANAIAGRNLELDRNAAIQALPLKSQALIVQSQIASDQGNLTEATDLLGQAKEAMNQKFQLQSDYETALYNWNKSKIDAVREYATAEQKAQLNARALEEERAYNEKVAQTKFENDVALKEIDAKNDAIKTPASYDEWTLAGGQKGTGKTFAEFLAGTTAGATTDVGKSIDQLNFLRDTAKNALALTGASGRSGARKTLESWFIGSTDYTKLVGYTNTLRTNVLTLMTNPDVKKFFGPQMSNADVQLMTSAGTTLNPELQDPKGMKEEIIRLDNLLNRMQTAVKLGSAGKSNVITAPDGTLIEIID